MSTNVGQGRAAVAVDVHVSATTKAESRRFSVGQPFTAITIGAWPAQVTLMGSADDLERLLRAALETVRTAPLAAVEVTA